MRTSHWLAAVLAALLLSLPLAGSRAAEPTKALSALGQVHDNKDVGCVSCHRSEQPSSAAPDSGCLKCHADKDAKDGRYAGTARKYTFSVGVTLTANPHQSHLIDLSCAECHKMHVPSVNYCAQCHGFDDMKVK